MKVKPKSNGLITINGDRGCVSLHVNQRWEATNKNGEYRIEYKLLSLYIDEELFNKMFQQVK